MVSTLIVVSQYEVSMRIVVSRIFYLSFIPPIFSLHPERKSLLAARQRENSMYICDAFRLSNY